MRRLLGLALVGAVGIGSCEYVAGFDWPGKPRAESLEGQPHKVLDFDRLYRQNCAGCHGQAGEGGVAVGLANPVYLALVDAATLGRIIADGVAGTSMPAFAERAGGLLTNEQVDVIARGMHQRWGSATALADPAPPPRAGPPGDAARGRAVYAAYCASCHGAQGTGGDKAGSIVDRSYLALVSAQGLRTTLIAGRPEIGQPDWRSDVPGRALSSQQIADVVAWLESHRAPRPGQ